MTILAFWTAGQFFIAKAYVLLVFAGIWALMQGIGDIVRAFAVRRLARSCSPLRRGAGSSGAASALRDRPIALAVADEADVAAGHLDAVRVGHELGLPAHDAVALGVDARQAHAVVRERRGEAVGERAAAAIA